jgi:hypothetical protein
MAQPASPANAGTVLAVRGSVVDVRFEPHVIDDELFDLIAGFEAQQAAAAPRKRASTQN